MHMIVHVRLNIDEIFDKHVYCVRKNPFKCCKGRTCQAYIFH